MSVGYRFTEAFSATFGVSLFFGRTQLEDMSVNPIGPAANRAGSHAYQDGTDRGDRYRSCCGGRRVRSGNRTANG